MTPFSLLRRWLLSRKELLPGEGNLILTNTALKSLGLKTLIEIKKRFDSEKKRKIGKIGEKRKRTDQLKKGSNWAQLKEFELKYQQKLILNQLKQLTTLTKKLEKRIVNLEQKLVKKK